MINAIKVQATDDFTITVDLEDGRTLRLDMNFIKNEQGHVIEPLKQIEEFKKAFIKNGIITWPTGYDIDPYFLETEGSIINQTA